MPSKVTNEETPIKLITKSTDMTKEMHLEVRIITLEALKQHPESPKDVARMIKQETEERHGHAWHCVVGTAFGMYIDHEIGHFIFMTSDDYSVVLYRSPP